MNNEKKERDDDNGACFPKMLHGVVYYQGKPKRGESRDIAWSSSRKDHKDGGRQGRWREEK